MVVVHWTGGLDHASAGNKIILFRYFSFPNCDVSMSPISPTLVTNVPRLLDVLTFLILQTKRPQPQIQESLNGRLDCTNAESCFGSTNRRSLFFDFYAQQDSHDSSLSNLAKILCKLCYFSSLPGFETLSGSLEGASTSFSAMHLLMSLFDAACGNAIQGRKQSNNVGCLRIDVV